MGAHRDEVPAYASGLDMPLGDARYRSALAMTVRDLYFIKVRYSVQADSDADDDVQGEAGGGDGGEHVQLGRAVLARPQEGDHAAVGGVDRGRVAGAAVLLAGEPGVGKSTLLLEVAAQHARAGARTLYVTGEESAAQVRLRADRTGGIHDELYLAAETDLATILGQVDATRPELLIVDSVQTVSSSLSDGLPGQPSQVREVASRLAIEAASVSNARFSMAW